MKVGCMLAGGGSDHPPPTLGKGWEGVPPAPVLGGGVVPTNPKRCFCVLQVSEGGNCLNLRVCVKIVRDGPPWPVKSKIRGKTNNPRSPTHQTQ